MPDVSLELKVGHGAFLLAGVELPHDSGETTYNGAITFTERPVEQRRMLVNNSGARSTPEEDRTQAVIYSDYTV